MFVESVKYEIVIGVPDNIEIPELREFNGITLVRRWKEVDFLEEMKLRWQSYAALFYNETGVYVSAIANAGHALYHQEWGCPNYGERVITFNCSANPAFIKNMDLYEEGVMYITKMLKADYQQHTITITKIPASVCYLTDEDNFVTQHESEIEPTVDVEYNIEISEEANREKLESIETVE